MNKQLRILGKIVLILLCLLVLKIASDRGREGLLIPPEGEYIHIQDVMILARALQEDVIQTDICQKLSLAYQEDNESNITYGDYLLLMEQIGTEQTPLFESKYQKEHFLLGADWYEAFEQMRAVYDTAGAISNIEIAVVGIGDKVSRGQADHGQVDHGQDGHSQGNVNVYDTIVSYTLEEKQMLTAGGKVYSFQSDVFMNYNHQKVQALCKDGQLLTVRKYSDDNLKLANVWLMEAASDEICFFYEGYEVKEKIQLLEDTKQMREQIADLTFKQGNLQQIDVKKEKIGGKLIAIGTDTITLEGKGTFEVSPDMKIYRLYETLKLCGMNELAIGYDFTEFVLENGQICGGLITRKETMEYIRVAVRTNDFGGLFHDQVIIEADTGFKMVYGPSDNRQTVEYAAGSKLELPPDSEYLEEGRVLLIPDTRTGKISLLSIDRSQGTPAYRGTIEIAREEEGLVVINEVLLEEYLYSVVPSEMPASYPMEALKAQAICARTYAYRYLWNAGLSAIGAHVDDSVAYQVYNNIAENTNTTKAVKETAGQMLYYEDNPAGTYYYSTSCGYGTVADVWKNSHSEDTSYLQAVAIGEQEMAAPEEMMSEETFAAFISEERETDYEKEEPWYRWSYEIIKIKKEKLEENLKKRYNSNPQQILTLEKETYVSKPVKQLGEITDIYCEKRLPGGVMDELIIKTEKSTYKVISENAIRYVLNDGETVVLRHDGSEVAAGSLLPSAFMIIDTRKENGNVIGYKLTGGGYGHGVGMSQNGARAMGNRGFTCSDILSCFYNTCYIEKVY